MTLRSEKLFVSETNDFCNHFVLFQSLIVRYRCKLELWDDSNGLEDGANPDLVIDRTNHGQNKYVDSLDQDDDYKHMDEKTSAYR